MRLKVKEPFDHTVLIPSGCCMDHGVIRDNVLFQIIPPFSIAVICIRSGRQIREHQLHGCKHLAFNPHFHMLAITRDGLVMELPDEDIEITHSCILTKLRSCENGWRWIAAHGTRKQWWALSRPHMGVQNLASYSNGAVCYTPLSSTSPMRSIACWKEEVYLIDCQGNLCVWIEHGKSIRQVKSLSMNAFDIIEHRGTLCVVGDRFMTILQSNLLSACVQLAKVPVRPTHKIGGVIPHNNGIFMFLPYNSRSRGRRKLMKLMYTSPPHFATPRAPLRPSHISISLVPHYERWVANFAADSVQQAVARLLLFLPMELVERVLGFVFVSDMCYI